MHPTSGRVASFLASRRLPWWLAALAVLLVAPALGMGLVVDDYVIRAAETGHDPELPPFDAFRFTDGANLRQLVDAGVLPWWTSPGLKLAFFRPLSAASHWLDFHLFPGSPAAMHAVSLAWLAATVAVAAVLYRRLLGEGWVAGLAALLFALDPGHALAAGWVSARNSVLAAFFGLLALYAHDRWRRDAARWGAFVAPLACAASLASGESGLATLALLFAHALAFDGPGLAARARALAPSAAVTLGWAIVYRVHGCGSAHSAMYLDPLSAPADYLRAAALSIPINLGARLGGPPATLAVILAAPKLPAFAVAAACAVVLAALALGPTLRRAPAARFFAVSAVLATLPIAGTLPNARNLFFVGFAALGLAALVVQRAAERRSWPLRIFAGWILLFDLVLALPEAPADAASMTAFAQLSREPLSRVLTDDAVRGQTVVFANPPAQFFVSHLRAMRAGTDVPSPARIRTLWPGIYPGRITRLAANEIAVHVDGGMLPPPGTWPASGPDAPAVRWEYAGQHLGSFVRGVDEPVRAGDVTSLSGCRVEVTAVAPAGGPTDVTFTFDRPLEDPSLRWLAWQDGDYVPLRLPAVGETVDLGPASMAPRRR